MKKSQLVGMAVLGILALAWIMWWLVFQGRRPSQVFRPPPDYHDQLALLERPVTFSVEDRSLEQAVQQLEAIVETPIEIDSDQFGIAIPRTRVTGTYHEQPLLQILEDLLQQSAHPSPEGFVGVQADRLVLSTPTRWLSGTDTYVTEIHTAPGLLSRPGFDRDRLGEILVTFFGAGQIRIAPDRLAPAALVVLHTPRTHQRIARLLDGLERATAPTASPATIWIDPPLTAQHQQIRDALESPIDVDLREVKLKDACAGWSAALGIEIRIDPVVVKRNFPRPGRRTLVRSKRNESIGVSARLKSVRFRSVLHLLLEPHGLTYQVRNNMLWITPLDPKCLRIYPVGDLLSGRRGAGDGDDLQQLFAEMVAPPNLVDGARPGEWGFYGTALIVRHVDRQHDRIEQTLAELRRLRRLPVEPADPAFWTDGRLHLENVLQSRVTWNDRQRPLDALLAILADRYDINIHVRQSELREIGIQSTAYVTLQCRDLPLERALRRMLEPLGVALRVVGETLVVTSQEEVEDNPELRPYQVARLVTPSDGGGQTVDDELIATIYQSVAPMTWEDGSGPGLLRTFQNVLFVPQTRENHELLAGVLKALESIPSSRDDRPRIAGCSQATYEHLTHRMQQPCVFEFRDLSWDEVWKRLEQAVGLPIVVHPHARDNLETSTAPVTGRYRGALASVFARLLREAQLEADLEDDRITLNSVADTVVIRNIPWLSPHEIAELEWSSVWAHTLRTPSGLSWPFTDCSCLFERRVISETSLERQLLADRLLKQLQPLVTKPLEAEDDVLLGDARVARSWQALERKVDVHLRKQPLREAITMLTADALPVVFQPDPLRRNAAPWTEPVGGLGVNVPLWFAVERLVRRCDLEFHLDDRSLVVDDRSLRVGTRNTWVDYLVHRSYQLGDLDPVWTSRNRQVDRLFRVGERSSNYGVLVGPERQAVEHDRDRDRVRSDSLVAQMVAYLDRSLVINRRSIQIGSCLVIGQPLGDQFRTAAFMRMMRQAILNNVAPDAVLDRHVTLDLERGSSLEDAVRRIAAQHQVPLWIDTLSTGLEGQTPVHGGLIDAPLHEALSGLFPERSDLAVVFDSGVVVTTTRTRAARDSGWRLLPLAPESTHRAGIAACLSGCLLPEPRAEDACYVPGWLLVEHRHSVLRHFAAMLDLLDTHPDFRRVKFVWSDQQYWRCSLPGDHDARQALSSRLLDLAAGRSAPERLLATVVLARLDVKSPALADWIVAGLERQMDRSTPDPVVLYQFCLAVQSHGPLPAACDPLGQLLTRVSERNLRDVLLRALVHCGPSAMEVFWRLVETGNSTDHATIATNAIVADFPRADLVPYLARLVPLLGEGLVRPALRNLDPQGEILRAVIAGWRGGDDPELQELAEDLGRRMEDGFP